MRRDGDMLTLECSGRVIPANCGILSPGDAGVLAHGYDDVVSFPDPLTPDERREIAAYGVAAWRAWERREHAGRPRLQRGATTGSLVFRRDVRRYFLDTEFIEDGRTIDLLSIAVVPENPGDPEFYLANVEADRGRANPWVRERVLPLLPPPGDPRWRDRRTIARDLSQYLGVGAAWHDPTGLRVELWGYYADYDWVVVCQLFGAMADLPAGTPKHCMDLKQLAVLLGDPPLPPQDPTDQHHALADARWNRVAFNFLRRRAEATP